MSRRGFLRGALGTSLLGCVVGRAADPPARPASNERRRQTVIDAHVHLRHGNAAHTEYAPEVIVRTMDEAGIDKSVVFAMSTTTRHSIEMASSAVKQFPDRLIPYVYALPNYERPVLREIEDALSQRGFRGIKIHAGECILAEYVVDPVLKLAGKCGVPCLIDCGGRLDAAERMARAFPGTKLIFAHMGRFLCRDRKLIDEFIRLAEKQPNVFLDVSGVVLTEMVGEAVRQIGSGRLIWGTDGPDVKPDIITFAREELEKIRRLHLPEAAERNLLGGTIQGILHL